MDDLISRQAAIDELVKMLGYCFQADGEVIDAVVTTINDLPSAQPKRGKWVEHKSTGYLMCDQCRDVYINPEWLTDGRWRFCPNCGSYNGGGAKMEVME